MDNRVVRNGVTLVELIVVVSVLIIVMAITFPAVLASRELSRRTTCSNNLHQVGIGVSNFHQRFRHLPFDRRGISALSRLAPDLEIATQEREGFGQVIKIATPLLRCPSESYRRVERPDAVNYFMNLGSAIAPLNGAVSPSTINPSDDGKVTFAEFTDGLSNSAVFSEHLQLRIECEDCNVSTKWWEADRRFSNELSLRTYLNGVVLNRDLIPLKDWLIFHDTVANSGFCYDHLWLPNRAMVDSVLAGGHRGTVQPPSSNHDGGVFVLFADGSVRFFSNSVDADAWSLVGSRNGNEPHAN